MREEKQQQKQKQKRKQKQQMRASAKGTGGVRARFGRVRFEVQPWSLELEA